MINTSNVAKIKLDSSGKIFLNGDQVSVDTLEKALEALKRANGVVWYYRENPKSEPDSNVEPVADAIMNAVVKAQVPVKLSSKPDYSDSIDEQGISIPGSDHEDFAEPSEPDGEPSYTNCLLVTLAKSRQKSVTVVSGRPLPDLSKLSSNDPDEQEWAARLPFKYNKLDADMIIDILLDAAGFRWYKIFKSSGMLYTELILSGNKSREVCFNITLSKLSDKRRQIQIRKEDI